LIAEGCIMARICHTNGCPVGVATQQEKLRARFTGLPEHVVNFFFFIAQEVRSLLARLGYRSLKDVIGRGDLLKVREGATLTKVASVGTGDKGLDLSAIVNLPDVSSKRHWLDRQSVHDNGRVLDDALLEDGEIRAAIEDRGSVEKTIELVNTDRSVGARLAGAIAKRYGNSGFEGQIALKFIGSAGQSFGAFNLPGMKLTLEGEANDYVGKGMHGGELVILPPASVSYDPAENSLIGNTCLYGATGGVLFAKGKAGERFAVRNSLGKAVIEGAGDHCCEYMTGGVVVVLGPVGRNVGAGMTGGIGYFLDEEGGFPERVNYEIVKIQRVSTAAGEGQLKGLIESYRDRTGSKKAKQILASWEEYLPKFWQVVPPSEADTPEAKESELVGEKAGDLLSATAKV
ncbi:MAG: glutamate synthase subunit alpha, partial [Okeania sp. SIO2H7]|nr:glutamate synthase subunit alpha [Okeania sp. SIO2H7]